MQGYNAQKASFSSTIQVKQLGHALFSINAPAGSEERESYLITLPSLHIESLIYGTPFVELNRYTQIASSTGYIAKIDFSGKGWLSGKKNTFNAILYNEREGEKKPLYSVDGQWSEGFVIKDARGKKSVVEKYSVKESKTSPFTLPPLDQQDLYESRRAWNDVATAIDKGDMDATSEAKSKIENAQRELRKIEKSENREWERRFFNRVDPKEDEVFMRLATMLDLTGGISSGIESDKTNGVWRFDNERSKDATPPYHKEGGRGLGVEEKKQES